MLVSPWYARTQLFQTVYKVHSQYGVGIMCNSGTWDPCTREMKAGGPRVQGQPGSKKSWCKKHTNNKTADDHSLEVQNGDHMAGRECRLTPSLTQ